MPLQAAATESQNGPRVLLIDDDEIVAGALFHQLQSTAIETEVAVDAAFAQQLLANYTYSLVVVDPYLTGNLHNDADSLLDHVRALQPHARIVILSAYGTRFSDRIVSDANLMIVGKPQSVLSMTAMIGHLLRLQDPL